MVELGADMHACMAAVGELGLELHLVALGLQQSTRVVWSRFGFIVAEGVHICWVCEFQAACKRHTWSSWAHACSR